MTSQTIKTIFKNLPGTFADKLKSTPSLSHCTIETNGKKIQLLASREITKADIDCIKAIFQSL